MCARGSVYAPVYLFGFDERTKTSGNFGIEYLQRNRRKEKAKLGKPDNIFLVSNVTGNGPKISRSESFGERALSDSVQAARADVSS